MTTSENDVRIERGTLVSESANPARLKSGTAHKLVLNMISTITMVRLGKSYQNFMVDLRATHAKLRARSERTLMRAAALLAEHRGFLPAAFAGH
ncbi:hypothetical protein [Specibacter sp. RAF43]|uniref:hypothetical protein n=1 Tax=Specibacter sp. RAF43 TaxID=3233057 RepID=UPI003F9631FF